MGLQLAILGVIEMTEKGLAARLESLDRDSRIMWGLDITGDHISVKDLQTQKRLERAGYVIYQHE